MYKTLGFDVTFSDEQKEILESIYKEIKNDSEIEDAEKNINIEMTKMLEGKEENHLLETLQEYTEIIYTNFVSYIDKEIIKEFRQKFTSVNSLKICEQNELCKAIDIYDTLIKKIVNFLSYDDRGLRFWVDKHILNGIERLTYKKYYQYNEYDYYEKPNTSNKMHNIEIYSMLNLKYDLFKQMARLNKTSDEFKTLYDFAVKLNWNNEIFVESTYNI